MVHGLTFKRFAHRTTTGTVVLAIGRCPASAVPTIRGIVSLPTRSRRRPTTSLFTEDIAMTSAVLAIALSLTGQSPQAYPAAQAPAKVAPAPQAPAKVAPAPQAPSKIAPAPQAPSKVAPAPYPAPQAPSKIAPAPYPAPQAPSKVAPAPYAAPQAPSKIAPA